MSYLPINYLLVALVLVVLASLFYWVFIYSRRLEETGYVGPLLKQTLYSAELKKRVAEVEEAWERGQYRRDAVNDEAWFSKQALPPQPKGADRLSIEFLLKQLRETGSSGTLPPFGKHNEHTLTYQSDLHNWENTILEKKARALRSEAIHRCTMEAKKESERAMGAIDLSTVMGRGPEFILQFTAVVTIVFVVLALGLVSKLDSQQAGTILAAIAGYVLGQATSRREPRESSTDKSSSQETIPPDVMASVGAPSARP